ncbi:MAG: ABC transporter permease [bacterium]
MNIWKISLRNIRSKPLYTFLSIITLSLSIALLLGIQQIKSSFKYQMENNLSDIDLVLGAKGSPLQLVLSSVLHLDNPTGNISYKEAMKIGNNPMVEVAAPISYGDNYKGFRIVGTTNDFNTFYEPELLEGKAPTKSLEVVLGHTVAMQTQLKIGDTFRSSHGLIENDIDVHNDSFVVVGIYKPTRKVIDKLIITDLNSIWDVHNHDHDRDSHQKEHEHEKEHDHEHGEAHDHDHEHEDGDQHEHEGHEEHKHDDLEGKEITSLLISFRNPMALLTLPRVINQETNMQAALPKVELDKLYRFTGIGFTTISWIAYIILVISGIIIFISLYKMVKERAFDLALLRSYGASNSQLIKMVSYEGFIIVCISVLIGFIFAKGGLYIISNILDSSQQNILQELPLVDYAYIFGLVFVMIIVSIALAIYPIIKMNISTILSNEK